MPAGRVAVRALWASALVASLAGAARAREMVEFPSPYSSGTIVISQSARKLFLVVDSRTAIAYPVGSTGTFSPVTLAAAEQAGYRAGFSFYGGFNPWGRMERFDIRRLGVARPTKALFELRTTLTLATGKHFF